ncbi:hypothetical protein PoB_003127900 [Plakobranchus ocellatus]|uniref:SMB domain-containing protein n=1 Tax=Plakobranchus ocellatus TaxID=259542 RepID=A0AAV4AAV0_9GAST|nr:hypothetical protein PoB_003127900 [Plakobranchus ocellatus]
MNLVKPHLCFLLLVILCTGLQAVHGSEESGCSLPKDPHVNTRAKRDTQVLSNSPDVGSGEAMSPNTSQKNPQEPASTVVDAGPASNMAGFSPVALPLPALGVKDKSSNFTGPTLSVGFDVSFDPTVDQPVASRPISLNRPNLFNSGNEERDKAQPGKLENHDPLVCVDRTDTISETAVDDICINNQGPWSCKGKCGRAVNYPCSCDVNCMLHKTCCHDFEEQCPDVAVMSIEELARFPGLRTICDPDIQSPLVSECPKEASEEEKKLCSLDKKSGSSLLDTAPVSDSYYLWSFRNKHCWRCWKTGHDALRWRVNITMSLGSRAEEDYRLDSLISFMAANPDKVLWYPPQNIVKGQCSDKVIGHCSACGVEDMILNLCVNGSDAYVKISSSVYKNLHCYLCSKHRQPDTKVTCIGAKVEDITMHNMNFPITMVLPDEDDSSDVEVIQDMYTVGAYSWDAMSCSLKEGACQASQCMPYTLIHNGRCDAGITPLLLDLRICVAKFTDGVTLICPKQEKTFQAAFNTPLSELLSQVTTQSDNFVKTYTNPNISLVDSAIVDDVNVGLHITVLWKSLDFFEISSELIWRHKFEIMNLIDQTFAHGLLNVCVMWGKHNVNTNFTKLGYDSCDMTFACQTEQSPSLDYLSDTAASSHSLDWGTVGATLMLSSLTSLWFLPYDVIKGFE